MHYIKVDSFPFVRSVQSQSYELHHWPKTATESQMLVTLKQMGEHRIHKLTYLIQLPKDSNKAYTTNYNKC